MGEPALIAILDLVSASVGVSDQKHFVLCATHILAYAEHANSIDLSPAMMFMIS
mgnify:CR=1 FL=1